MIVDVHLSDGRTVFRLMSRAKLIQLIKRDPAALDENASVRAWVRWHPQAELEPIQLQYVKKHQIGFVRQLDPDERDAFLRDTNAAIDADGPTRVAV